MDVVVISNELGRSLIIGILVYKLGWIIFIDVFFIYFVFFVLRILKLLFIVFLCMDKRLLNLRKFI